MGNHTMISADRASAGLRRALILAGAVGVVGALLLLDLIPLAVYGLALPTAVVVFGGATFRYAPGLRRLLARLSPDTMDLGVMSAFYIAVVAFLSLAFRFFTTARTAGLFLSFAAALLVGSVGPIVYTAWIRKRPLHSLGIGRQNLGRTLLFGLVFAAVQFAVTLHGQQLPADLVDWVPLLVMSLTVGLFEAVFFRGFIQGRLEASFRAVPAVIGAAALYALYHVGYGMAVSELLFLFGLGATYAVAYRTTQNILVAWPLLSPVGSFFNNLESGDISLPWAAIAGFADVLVLMGVALWLAFRVQRKRAAAEQEGGLLLARELMRSSKRLRASG